eukprot:489762-Prorocentrum_minimum.AAC.2
MGQPLSTPEFKVSALLLPKLHARPPNTGCTFCLHGTPMFCPYHRVDLTSHCSSKTMVSHAGMVG